MLRLFLFLTLVALTGCTARERIDLAQPRPDVATLHPVLVATTRAADPEQDGIPGWERSERLGFAEFMVSVPMERETGRIPRPRGGATPDEARHFMMAGATPLDALRFQVRTRNALAPIAVREREAVIFVHGFNTNFVEGVYRTAQLAQDLRLPGVMMHYSWPSLGAPLAYAHDRDSALFARDGLVRMIQTVRDAGAQRIVLIAHSMGSQLTMEALRQLAIARDPALSSIGGVVLISPDIDVEVFRSQARRFDRLPQPFFIVTSQRDRMLALSAGLTGERRRLGNIDDLSAIEDLGVTLIDVSAFSQGTGHFTVGDSASLIALMDQVDLVDSALSDSESGSLPLVPATILTVQNTTQVILQPLADPDRRRPRRWWLPFAN